MRLREFIRKNRDSIDKAINDALFRHDGKGGRGVVPDPPPRRNDEDRRLWIHNDWDLYCWARSEGVDI